MTNLMRTRVSILVLILGIGCTLTVINYRSQMQATTRPLNATDDDVISIAVIRADDADVANTVIDAMNKNGIVCSVSSGLAFEVFVYRSRYHEAILIIKGLDSRIKAKLVVVHDLDPKKQ